MAPEKVRKGFPSLVRWARDRRESCSGTSGESPGAGGPKRFLRILSIGGRMRDGQHEIDMAKSDYGSTTGDAGLQPGELGAQVRQK